MDVEFAAHDEGRVSTGQLVELDTAVEFEFGGVSGRRITISVSKRCYLVFVKCFLPETERTTFFSSTNESMNSTDRGLSMLSAAK